MKFNFLSKTLPAIGLDVGSSSLKALLMQKTKHGFVVKGCTETLMPKALILNDQIADQKTFIFLLKQALHKPQFGRFDTNYAVASLPESKSFVRVIQIPKMSEAEAENAVPYEAESFIPMPLDQVYLDWQKIGESGDKMNVLMVASPKEYVDKYLQILDEAGLKVVALEVDSQSCHRVALAAGSKQTVLLIDLDAFRSSMIMVEDGNLQFTSTIPIAGNSFTESVARTLGVSSAKAEEIKRIVGIANTAEYPNIKTSLLPVLNNLSAEIKNILKFHSEHSDRQVEKILLMGGSSRLKNLAEFLALELRDSQVAAVEVINPWLNLGTGFKAPFDQDQSLGFCTAIGLGMRGSNYQVD